ncbi:MAG: chromosome segregation protein SMC, partial [Thermoproteota archaeon]
MALKNFVFGNIILVDSKESAYVLSKKGYKAVTTDGQFFEADANAVVVDINSKISKLTKIILLSTSVDDIIQALSLLKKFIQDKKSKLKKIERITKSLEDKYHVSETGLANVDLYFVDIKAKVKSITSIENQIASRISQLTRHDESLKTNAAKVESYIASLEERITVTKENYAEEEQARIANALTSLNEKKSSLLSAQTSVMNQIREQSTNLTDLTNNENTVKSSMRMLHEEQSGLNHEKHDLEVELHTMAKEKEKANVTLVSLREKEQQLISTSGTSVSTFKEYDTNLKGLYETERSLTKEINNFERQSDSISRDIHDLTENEVKIRATLTSYGYDELLETFDVDQMLTKLEAEKKVLSGTLNTKSPEAYVEISNGYRSMSTRKNELEEERNSIVRFIEEIEKDKRQTFLEAYDKVDQDIRKVFNTMTGGNAWLEMQNEDDIFNSGISYLIQFPDKQKRESTSISGGEKTLAAITFLLALQTLKPSPFYLLDEVDAH